jgi:hypothetical protein
MVAWVALLNCCIVKLLFNHALHFVNSTLFVVLGIHMQQGFQTGVFVEMHHFRETFQLETHNGASLRQKQVICRVRKAYWARVSLS